MRGGSWVPNVAIIRPGELCVFFGLMCFCTYVWVFCYVLIQAITATQECSPQNSGVVPFSMEKKLEHSELFWYVCGGVCDTRRVGCPQESADMYSPVV